MSMNVEDSDTDDQEKSGPGPSKRQHIVESTQNLKSSDKNSQALKQLESTIETANDEEDRIAREKLQVWQACQVAMGVIDNTKNRIIEHHTTPRDTYPCVNPCFPLFPGNQMEYSAMEMALHNIELSYTSGLDQAFSEFERIMEGNLFNESDHQQDFLDRAVAAAIKAKGLSRPSVDYG